MKVMKMGTVCSVVLFHLVTEHGTGHNSALAPIQVGCVDSTGGVGGVRRRESPPFYHHLDHTLGPHHHGEGPTRKELQ